MIKRIIEITSPAYLYMKRKQLMIENKSELIGQVPIEDIGILILEHSAIVLTQAMLIACQKNNVAVVFCDNRHLPYSVLLPISEGNNLHSKIIKQQINISQPTKKRLWQQIVKQKIIAQAEVLKCFDKNSKVIKRLALAVKSGDKENIEAQAAQKYWHLLFGQEFKRDTTVNGVNSLLNYGYAIVRAMLARAIVSGGLHPALGIQHSNQYNGLCLADDLMEPFRPWVDWLVYRLNLEAEIKGISKENKQEILSLPGQEVLWKQQKMPFMVAVHYLIAEIKKAFEDKTVKIQYPQLIAMQ